MPIQKEPKVKVNQSPEEFLQSLKSLFDKPFRNTADLQWGNVKTFDDVKTIILDRNSKLLSDQGRIEEVRVFYNNLSKKLEEQAEEWRKELKDSGQKYGENIGQIKIPVAKNELSLEIEGLESKISDAKETLQKGHHQPAERNSLDS